MTHFIDRSRPFQRHFECKFRPLEYSGRPVATRADGKPAYANNTKGN